MEWYNASLKFNRQLLLLAFLQCIHGYGNSHIPFNMYLFRFYDCKLKYYLCYRTFSRFHVLIFEILLLDFLLFPPLFLGLRLAIFPDGMKWCSLWWRYLSFLHLLLLTDLSVEVILRYKTSLINLIFSCYSK